MEPKVIYELSAPDMTYRYRVERRVSVWPWELVDEYHSEGAARRRADRENDKGYDVRVLDTKTKA